MPCSRRRREEVRGARCAVRPLARGGEMKVGQVRWTSRLPSSLPLHADPCRRRGSPARKGRGSAAHTDWRTLCRDLGPETFLICALISVPCKLYLAAGSWQLAPAGILHRTCHATTLSRCPSTAAYQAASCTTKRSMVRAALAAYEDYTWGQAPSTKHCHLISISSPSHPPPPCSSHLVSASGSPCALSISRRRSEH